MSFVTEQVFIGTRASDQFTDRREPQEAFWDKYNNLIGKRGESDAICFYGSGGIGKTSLLKKLANELISNKGNQNVIVYSFEFSQDKADFLSSLARKIGELIPESDFSVFYYAYNKYLELNGESSEARKAKMIESPKGIINLENAARMAVTVGTDFIPLGNTIGKITDALIDLISNKINERVGKNKNERKIKDEIDKAEQSTLLKDLHKYFSYDFSNILLHNSNVKGSFVIMLDGYEFLNSPSKYGVMADINDLWLSGSGPIQGIVRTLPNVLWVIAGRDKINWDNTILPAESCHLLENLSKNDVKEYFKTAKDPEGNGMGDELISALYDLTQGTPVFMDLCFDIFASGNGRKKEDFGENTTSIAARYLSGMSNEEQIALKFLCALTNSWTDAIATEVAELVGSGEYKTYLEKIPLLKKHTFIEKSEDNTYRLHSTLRLVIRDITDKEELKKITDTVFNYILEKIEKNPNSSRVEYIYYLQLMDANIEEYFELLKKNDKKIDQNMLCRIQRIYNDQAQTYEEYGFLEKAVYYRDVICKNWREWGSEHEKDASEKIANAESKLGNAYLKFADINPDYYKNAVEHFFEAVKIYDKENSVSNDWKTLNEKKNFGRAARGYLNYCTNYNISDVSKTIEEIEEYFKIKLEKIDNIIHRMEIICEKIAESCLKCIKEQHLNEKEESARFLYDYYFDVWSNDSLFEFLETLMQSVGDSNAEMSEIAKKVYNERSMLNNIINGEFEDCDDIESIQEMEKEFKERESYIMKQYDIFCENLKMHQVFSEDDFNEALKLINYNDGQLYPGEYPENIIDIADKLCERVDSNDYVSIAKVKDKIVQELCNIYLEKSSEDYERKYLDKMIKYLIELKVILEKNNGDEKLKDVCSLGYVYFILAKTEERSQNHEKALDYYKKIYNDYANYKKGFDQLRTKLNNEKSVCQELSKKGIKIKLPSYLGDLILEENELKDSLRKRIEGLNYVLGC